MCGIGMTLFYCNVFCCPILLYKNSYIGMGIMNQEMHTWIASVLSWLTILIIQRDLYLPVKDDVSAIAFFIHIAMGILCFGIWLYKIT